MRRRLASTFWTIPAVLLLLAAVSAWGPGDGVRGAAGQDQVTVHTVVITVDAATGQISYSLDPVEAKRGDHIEWTCEQGAWSVHFIDRTPLNQDRVRGPQGGPRRLPVRQNAEIGSYKYFVAVAIGDDVFTDDPEIIIGGV